MGQIANVATLPFLPPVTPADFCRGTHRRLAGAVLQQLWRDAQADARAALREVRAGGLDHWLEVLDLDRHLLILRLERLERLAAEQPEQTVTLKVNPAHSGLFDLSEAGWLDELIDSGLSMRELAVRHRLPYSTVRAIVQRCLSVDPNETWRSIVPRLAPQLLARAAERTDDAAVRAHRMLAGSPRTATFSKSRPPPPRLVQPLIRRPFRPDQDELIALLVAHELKVMDLARAVGINGVSVLRAGRACGLVGADESVLEAVGRRPAQFEAAAVARGDVSGDLAADRIRRLTAKYGSRHALAA